MSHPARYLGGPHVDEHLSPIVPIHTHDRPRRDVQQLVLKNHYRPPAIFRENSVTDNPAFWDRVAALKRQIADETKPFFWLTPQQQEIKQHRRFFRTPLYGESSTREDAYHTVADSIYGERWAISGYQAPARGFQCARKQKF